MSRRVLVATGLVAFASQYEVEIFWVGLAFIAAGVAFTGSRPGRPRRSLRDALTREFKTCAQPPVPVIRSQLIGLATLLLLTLGPSQATAGPPGA